MAKSDALIPIALLGVGLMVAGGGKKKKPKSGSSKLTPDEQQRIRNVEALPASYLEADAQEDPGDRVIPEMLAPGRPDDKTLGP